MGSVIFVGPTVSVDDILEQNLFNDALVVQDVSLITNKQTNNCDLIIAPPVSGGDIYNLVQSGCGHKLGIIDGYFENTISVWHKEILYALTKKIPVLGASSMGALRAAELYHFGMIGVGKIFNQFKSSELTDDDEVTVAHGPAKLGYPQISEAMVNIRATAQKAMSREILSKDVHDLFIRCAKSIFYKNRNYGSIIRSCIDQGELTEKDFSRFHLWLQKHRVDQKKQDALQLLTVLQNQNSNNIQASLPDFEFEDTLIWRSSINA